jgi:hypothetical protein
LILLSNFWTCNLKFVFSGLKILPKTISENGLWICRINSLIDQNKFTLLIYFYLLYIVLTKGNSN